MSVSPEGKSNRINFTKRKIDSLPVPEPGTRARYYDEKTNGLLLQITSNGARTYWVRRKVKGVSQWQRIGDDEIDCFGWTQYQMNYQWCKFHVALRFVNDRCTSFRVSGPRILNGTWVQANSVPQGMRTSTSTICVPPELFCNIDGPRDMSQSWYEEPLAP